MSQSVPIFTKKKGIKQLISDTAGKTRFGVIQNNLPKSFIMHIVTAKIQVYELVSAE